MLQTQSNRLQTPRAMLQSPIPRASSITNLMPTVVQKINAMAVKAIAIIVVEIIVYSFLNVENVLPKQIALASPKITQIVPGII
jgi:hypothetical protein